MLFVQQELLDRKILSLQVGVQILCQRSMLKNNNNQHWAQALPGQSGPSLKSDEGVSVL